jgi:cytoskeletal protein RodZ
MPNFGTTFRAAREAQDLTLEQVAERTRIGVRFLRAIEEEAFHMLPGGIFNRGFIRTYAERIGLDPDQILTEYAVLTDDLGTPDPITAIAVSRASSVDRYVLPVAVGALLLLVGLYYVFAQGPPAAVDAEQESAAEIREAVALAEGTLDPAIATRTLPADSSAALSEPSSVAGGGAVRVGDGSTNVNPTTPARLPGPAAPDRENDTPASAGAESVQVQLQVHDTTWISVQSDGEQIEIGVTLEAGTNRTFEAREALDLTIGNAAGLTVQINGEEVRNLGNEGQVRHLNITPRNFRSFTGS